jgi:hypothetical protein
MTNQGQIDQYIRHVEAQLVQFEFTPPERREHLLIQMKDLLIQAETLKKGSGSWLMACLHGRMKEPEMCLKWLERAKKNSALPAKQKLQTSSYMKTFCQDQWFIEFTNTLDD